MSENVSSSCLKFLSQLIKPIYFYSHLRFDKQIYIRSIYEDTPVFTYDFIPNIIIYICACVFVCVCVY